LIESPLAGAKLRLVESVSDAADLMTWLGERREGPVAIDTESGGLDKFHDRLRMVQFGDLHTGYAVPWERWGGVALEVMNKYQGDWVTHNGVYDWCVLKIHTGFELPWHRLEDTLTLARLDDPSRDNRLKPLASRLVDRRAGIMQKSLDEGMHEHGWTWDTVPIEFPPYWIYAGLDSVETAHIFKILSPRIQESIPQSYDLERAANRICANMMMRGLRVDVPYVHKAIENFRDSIQKIREWLKRVHSITSPKSGGQISRAFERLGQEVLFWTDGNSPQFDKNALEHYQAYGNNPAVQQLAKYIRAVRHTEDITDRYLEAFIKLRDANDLIHCNINVMGARTGRMSVSDPPLQQLPRDDKVIRGAFIPREGHVFVACDLDQAEMRIIAHVSRDPGLLEAFLNADNGGDDFFTAVASTLYNEKLTKADKRRQLTKNASYARAYGSGTANLAVTAGVSVEEVAAFESMFDERFPGMKQLMNRLEFDAKEMEQRKERPGVRLASGRFLPSDANKAYTTFNYLIQGTCAEFLKECLVRIDSAGLGDALCLPVHDEVILEVPVEQAEEARRTLQECMTDYRSYLTPMTAEAKIMTERWAK
jgi:DNA polymerase-1